MLQTIGMTLLFAEASRRIELLPIQDGRAAFLLYSKLLK